MMKLFLAQRFDLQGAAGLGALRLQHLDTVLLCGRVLTLLLLLRRYHGTFLFGAVDL